MRTISLGVAALLTTAVFLPSSIEAGEFYGKVLENDGRSLQYIGNVRVEVFERKRTPRGWQDTVLYATTTKRDGSYSLDVRRRGRFGIRVIRRGHRTPQGKVSYPTMAITSKRGRVALTLEIYKSGNRWYLKERR